MQMLKSYYSAEEVLQLLNKKSSLNLSYKDLKDLCLRGKLTPAIYFEGNIVCIHEERSPNEIDARELGPHERSVSWTSIFKGYLHSRDFLDFLESSTVSNPKTDVFFRFEKIIECLESENEIKLLNQNEYLKAFSRMTDDDIRNIRWLIEAHHFEGNPFSSTEIVFHHSEVDALFSAKNNIAAVNSDTPNFYNTNGIQAPAQEEYIVEFFKGSKPLSVSDQIDKMSHQIKKLENEKKEHLEKIGRLELEIDIKNDDIIKACVNNGLLSAIVKKLENKQSITVDDLTHLQKNGLCETINNQKIYTTPALEALYGVIKEHWVNYDPDNHTPPKQGTVADWIKDNYAEVQASDICIYIDKICRHPKAKRGGNIKRKATE